MKTHNIFKAAVRANLTIPIAGVFLEFFSKRFPDESDNITTYVDEWAQRFKSGHPESYMDGSSYSIYQQAIIDCQVEK